MSVTFQSASASWTYVQVPCDSPSMGLVCTAEERCGYCDEGMREEQECDSPTAQFSNYNAAGLQAILGLPVEEWGEVSHGDIPAVLQKFMVVLNDEDHRAGLTEAPFEERGETTTVITTNEEGLSEITTRGGCRMISMGNTDSQTERRLTRLREIFVWAHQNNSGVSWG